MTQHTEESIAQARRAYKSDLARETIDRCASCEHRAVKGCGLLEVAIADPYKSACPLYQFDGIPF